MRQGERSMITSLYAMDDGVKLRVPCSFMVSMGPES